MRRPPPFLRELFPMTKSRRPMLPGWVVHSRRIEGNSTKGRPPRYPARYSRILRTYQRRPAHSHQFDHVSQTVPSRTAPTGNVFPVLQPIKVVGDHRHAADPAALLDLPDRG